eukprot:6104003-Prymnesium_polylepis.1
MRSLSRPRRLALLTRQTLGKPLRHCGHPTNATETVDACARSRRARQPILEPLPSTTTVPALLLGDEAAETPAPLPTRTHTPTTTRAHAHLTHLAHAYHPVALGTPLVTTLPLAPPPHPPPQRGDFFGELALMYNAPRAATILCAESGTLH